MKRTIKNILALAAICLMWSCEKAEVPVYNSPTAINFLAPDGYGGFKDDYLNLSVEINLYEQYLKTMDVNESELQIGFQIEGLIPETDMRVRFSTEAVEDYEQAQVELPTDTVIRAGQYKQTATIKCLKPAEMEKAYATYAAASFPSQIFISLLILFSSSLFRARFHRHITVKMHRYTILYGNTFQGKVNSSPRFLRFSS